MTPKQRKLARHALGLPNRNMRNYRNRFVAAYASGDYDEWVKMVDAGLAEAGTPRRTVAGSTVSFWLTEAGAKAALDAEESFDRWPPPPADVAPVPGQMKGKTMTDKAEIAALVKLLQRPYGNLTGGERQSVATAITALQAQLAAAEAPLGAAYRAALEDAAGRIKAKAEMLSSALSPKSSQQMTVSLTGGIAELNAAERNIRAMPVPADLAARLATEARE